MKKFRFTLDKLKKYQEQILEEEKSTLGRLNYTLRQIQRRIHSLEQDFLHLSRELMEEEAAGIHGFALRGYHLQLDSVRQQLKVLEQEEEQAQQAVDAQMNVVLAASQEVSKLEKLEERQREDYRKGAAKEQELFIEELISSKSIRQQIS